MARQPFLDQSRRDRALPAAGEIGQLHVQRVGELVRHGEAPLIRRHFDWEINDRLAVYPGHEGIVLEGADIGDQLHFDRLVGAQDLGDFAQRSDRLAAEHRRAAS